MSNGFFSTTQVHSCDALTKCKTQTASPERNVRIGQLSMFTMHTDLRLHHRDSGHRLGTSTDKRTRWIRLRGGRNTSHSHIRRSCMKGASCPSRTGCLDKIFIMPHEKRRRVRLFRDDNPDFAFSPQYVDADILRMMFKQEVDFGVSNPEILNFNVFQERRQHWL